MLQKYQNIHEHNIKTIDDIIESINKYLNYMLKVWDFRIQENRSPAIKNWKDRFIDCKVHLSGSYESISFQLQHLGLLKSVYSPDHKSDLQELAKVLPLIHKTEIGGYRNVINISNHSQDRIIESVMNHSLSIKSAIDQMFPMIEKSFAEYTRWIGELEKTKSSNYVEMGLVEYLLMKESNTLGRSLTEHISNEKFLTLSFSDAQSLFKFN